MANIEKTDLFKEFIRRAPEIAAAPPDLAEEFQKLRTLLQDTEKYIVLSFPEYTPHDHARHLDGLFGLADRLFGLNVYNQLGSAELALLVFGLYAHDWGMAVTEAELRNLFSESSEPEFGLLPGEPAVARDYVSNATSNGLPDQVAQREYIRRTHASRSGARLRTYFENTSRVFADSVAKIAEGHTLDIRELRDSQRYPVAQSVFGETVNLAALATYVRIIDLLDIGDDRTPYALWKFVSPRNEVSRIEWEKHRALSPAAIKDNDGIREVNISGWTDDSTVFSALADLRSWIDSQFGESMALLKMMPSKYYPRFDSRIKWNIEAVGFNPILVRFECERAAVLGLLSNELYRHDPLAFVRELLQNSVDAIDSRESLLKDTGLTLSGKIRVKLRSTNGSICLEWSDNGIGMDTHVMSSYFASIGQSWYKSREARRFGDSHPVSQFGIGVLSFFAVSDRITVTTRKDPHASDTSGVIVEIPGRESYFRIQPTSDAPVGTTIRLTISRNFAAISKESIVAALAKICRFVRHSVIVDLDDTLISLAAGASVQAGTALSIKAIRGNSAQLFLEACTLVDIEFGDQSENLQGTYSALIPKIPTEIQGPVRFKEWLIGDQNVSLEDIVTDSEQSVFTKGIQVGPVVPVRRAQTEVNIGARYTDWIPPKILVNVRNPSCLKFDLNRSVAHFSSKESTNAMWSGIARTLKTLISDAEPATGAEAAILLGTCALFGGIPDIGLRALLDPKIHTPLLVLRSEQGTGWQFIHDFIRGDEFSEAPFELAYASSNSEIKVEQNALAGWRGEDMLFPVDGISTRQPPYLRQVLSFGEDILTDSGWMPAEIRFVQPPINESVPLACRVWRKRGTGEPASSVGQQPAVLQWNALRQVCEASPQLLRFPEGAEKYVAIGSRYWNASHPKSLAMTRAMLELAHRFKQGKLTTEKSRLFTYLTSNAFYGYTVPSRLTGRTLAIELPNRLLDLTEGEFTCSERLAESDFFPGTVGKYHNPYHYGLWSWESSNTPLGLLYV